MPQLAKPYLRSSIDATVKQYKNYLASKILNEQNINIPATEVILQKAHLRCVCPSARPHVSANFPQRDAHTVCARMGMLAKLLLAAAAV